MAMANWTDADLSVDVTVVGAGLVGLSAALALHEAGYTVALLDGGPEPALAQNSAADWDARIYAISPNNAKWLADLAVWPLLDTARMGSIQSMHIFAEQQPLILSAEDERADCLAFVVEARALQQALYARVKASNMLTVFNSACVALSTTATQTSVQLANKQKLQSRLLIAADGSQSWLRQELGMAVQQKSYQQRAIVANFRVEQAHANVARQWFYCDAQGEQAILAWLPLADNLISIVWSVSLPQAERLLALPAADFSLALMQAGGHALGHMQLINTPQAYPLRLQISASPVQGSVVLVGDAAHQIHPMAGQGVNLGFRDVIDLLQVLQEKNPYQALNDSGLLKRYTRRRKADVLNMQLLTDGLFQVFASQNELLKSLRTWAWSAAKQRLIKQRLLASALNL